MSHAHNTHGINLGGRKQVSMGFLERVSGSDALLGRWLNWAEIISTMAVAKNSFSVPGIIQNHGRGCEI